MRFGAGVSNDEILQHFTWEHIHNGASKIALRYYVFAENLLEEIPRNDRDGYREAALYSLKMSRDAAIKTRY